MFTVLIDDVARIAQFTSASDEYRFVDHVTDLSVDKLLLCFTDAEINCAKQRVRFCNTQGVKMTQTNITAALMKSFSDAGVKQKATCTRIRKTSVTRVHKAHPDHKHDVAVHMLHPLHTAEKHYRFVNLWKRCNDKFKRMHGTS